MSENIISVKNLSKSYQSKSALQNISLEIKKGQFLALIGPNGAGKTTLIKILSGLLLPTQVDSIWVNGYVPGESQDGFKKSVSLVLDSSQLYNNLSAYENLKYTCLLYGIKNYKKKINDILKKVKLLDCIDQQVGTYSTGMKQRLNIARALVTDAEIIILDEPSSGLDPLSVIDLYKILCDINFDKKTILLCTHNMNEVENYTDYVICLNEGKIVAEGTPVELKNEFSSMIFSIKTGQKELFESVFKKLNIKRYLTLKRQNIWEFIIFDSIPDELLLRNDINFTKRDITLEDIFLYVINMEKK